MNWNWILLMYLLNFFNFCCHCNLNWFHSCYWGTSVSFWLDFFFFQFNIIESFFRSFVTFFLKFFLLNDFQFFFVFCFFHFFVCLQISSLSFNQQIVFFFLGFIINLISFFLFLSPCEHRIHEIIVTDAMEWLHHAH